MRDLPTALSEMDRLKLTLAKEREARLRAEAANIQMAQQQVNAARAQMEIEHRALMEQLKQTYSLTPGDEVGEDGSIKRAPVRAIKEG